MLHVENIMNSQFNNLPLLLLFLLAFLKCIYVYTIIIMHNKIWLGETDFY